MSGSNVTIEFVDEEVPRSVQVEPEIHVEFNDGRGPKGDPGESAYQVAVDNGFVGTEEEWLASLGGGGTAGTGPAGRGITSIDRTAGDGSAGTTDTYTITYSDDTTSTFSVYNGNNGAPGAPGSPGRGIASFERTAGDGSAGSTDTYTLTFTDASTATLTVYNGANGSPGSSGAPGTDGRGIVSVTRTSGDGSAGSTDTYTITYTDASTSNFTVVNGSNGAPGPAGPGLPMGGATGTFPQKVDATDYNVAWVNLFTLAATLSNKRITKRANVVAGTAGSTLTMNWDSYDAYGIGAQDADLSIAAIGGTPTPMQPMMLRLKDNGTARAITWDASFRAMLGVGVALPTTTTAGKAMAFMLVWNSIVSKVDVIGVTWEA